ncbi:MAG TPA: hypothetical protein VN253_06400 [Kofleriaceae bacterium]|nr:hypothetical protein [Kofleriaceae bacterium]
MAKDPNPSKMVCTDAFKVTGTWTAGTPVRDADSPTGCWPVGTWNFTVSLDPTDTEILDITGDRKPDRCGAVSATKAATFDGSYSFVVTRTDDGDGWVDAYALTGAVTQGSQKVWNTKVIYKLDVSEGGAGECEGGIELYSADGKEYWNLKPSLTGNSIAGFGNYALYEETQL